MKFEVLHKSLLSESQWKSNLMANTLINSITLANEKNLIKSILSPN